MIIAMIQPIRAFTNPSPPPRICVRIPPDQVTRSSYEKPVVASKSADEDAIRLFMKDYQINMPLLNRPKDHLNPFYSNGGVLNQVDTIRRSSKKNSTTSKVPYHMVYKMKRHRKCYYCKYDFYCFKMHISIIAKLINKAS